MTRLEYELAYYDSAVHHINHFTTRTPPPDFLSQGTVKGLEEEFMLTEILLKLTLCHILAVTEGLHEYKFQNLTDVVV